MTLGSLAQPAQPGLATRKGIAWALNPPTEDSSVLVLTTPEKHYIDIRFALSGPSLSGPFWAFAGTATYTPLHKPTDTNLSTGWETAIRGEWAHPIDSMGNFDGVDKADIFTLPTGDQVEFGTLENPDNGKIELFKEYWTAPEDADVRYPVVRAVKREGDVVKGMVIRVGNWVQGIEQVDDSTVRVARWKLAGGEWKVDERGSKDADSLPLKWVVETDRKVGEKTDVGGKQWEIAEVVLTA